MSRFKNHKINFLNFLMKFLIVFIIVLPAIFFFIKESGAEVPRMFSYQGRLYDDSNNLLGGSGTTYYFRISVWNNEEVGLGSRLWPSSASQIMSAVVEYGVFNILVGDTSNGGDELTIDFNEEDYYLQIEVASQPDFSDGETLNPRQRIVASGFAINSDFLNGYQALESASSTTIPVLTDGNLFLGATSPQINATNTNNLSLQGQANSGNLILNDLSGFVGIGTDSPQAKFHIKNNGVSFIMEGDDHSYMEWYPQGYENGRKAYLGFLNATSTNLTLVNESSDGDISFVPINGNVGIGTQNPSSKLEIVGGYATGGLSGGEFGLHLASSGESPNHSQIWWGDNTGWKLNFGTKDADDNFAPRVTFTDTGNVGIGVNSPQAKFHIKNNGVSFIMEGDDHSYMEWYPKGYESGRKMYMGFPYTNSTDFVFVNEYSDGDISFVPTNGNVGIGAQNPSSKLEVVGGYATSSLAGGGFGLHLSSGGTNFNHSQIWWGDNTGWKLNFGTKDADDNFAPHVTFTDTGMVGIGTSSPSHTLEVKGASKFYGDFSILPIYNSTSSVKISDGLNTEDLFNVDTINNRVKIGDNDVAGNPTTLLVLDSKEDAGDPIGVNGAVYYNSNLNKFRCYTDGAWGNCGGGGAQFQSYALFKDAEGLLIRNLSSSGEEIPNKVAHQKIDLSANTEVRAQFAHSLSSDVIKLRVDFSTDGCSTWNAVPLVPSFGSDVGANNNQTSSFSNIPSEALGDICTRVVFIGNNTMDPIIRYVNLDVK
ncbi:MAG: hypothetical protein U9P90_00635 [Patescibacteria group bacterium]|nr:hypothetical protein [Patescibacteria group bacterium]